MYTPNQKSFSSSKPSKQYLLTPSTSPKSKSTSSYTSHKAQHGSHTSHHSASASSSSRSSHNDSATQEYQGEAIKRYENEPRDYKSWNVEAYDTYQEQASEEHWDEVGRDVRGVNWAC